MGDNMKQSKHIALVACAACTLLTLVTCSFVLSQYYRWQGELTNLRDQIVKTLPMCSSANKVVNADQRIKNRALVRESSSEDLRTRSSAFSGPSSTHNRLRRNADENEETTGRSKKNRNKRRESQQRASATHMVLSHTIGAQTSTRKRPNRQLRAIQFKLDADKYKNLTANNKMSILPWWNPEEWCQRQSPDFFEYNNSTGHLKILTDGLYYVYAQITYTNSASMNSFDVKIDNVTALVSCTQERRFPPGLNASTVVENCHAASMARLWAGQTLSVWNAVNGFYFRQMDITTGATFWGVMRIGHS